jgi:ACT domain-containing protein
VTVRVPDRPGQLARVATRLAELNCNICSVVSSRSEGQGTITMRLEGAERDDVVQALKELEGVTVLSVWQSDQGAFK